MMRHQKHLFAALHQRLHKGRHKGRLGDAGGLPLTLADGVLDDGALGRVAGAAQKPQLLGYRRHQLAVYAVVPVDLLHQPALGRQLPEHIALQAAQHQAFASQIVTQKLGLCHDGAVVTVAPLPGKALPVTQKVEIQYVYHVPNLAAVVVNGRAGEPDAVFAGLRKQARGAVLASTVSAQFLDFIEDHRAKAAFRQQVLPAAQQQIVHQVDIRLRQGIGFQTVDNVHTKPFIRVQKAGNLALPVADQVGRSHDDSRISRRRGQKGQCLHRLAQSHVIGQQTSSRPQQKGQSLLLEIQQLSRKAFAGWNGGFRQTSSSLTADGVVPGFLQGAVPALPIALGDLQRIA